MLDFIVSNDVTEIRVLVIMVSLLLLVYLYVRKKQVDYQRRIKRYAQCKELILNNRRGLAREGVDFEKLAGLVRQDITVEQLETTIELLTAPRTEYLIDEYGDPEGSEINLDIFPDEKKKKGKDGESETESAGEVVETLEKFDDVSEKKWLDAATERFKKAASARGLSDNRSQVRLLVKMVELGKKAIDDNPDKNDEVKLYESRLWDKFYEAMYLDINSRKQI